MGRKHFHMKWDWKNWVFAIGIGGGTEGFAFMFMLGPFGMMLES